MCSGNLSGLVLQNVGISSLQYSWQSAMKSSRMFAQLFSATTGFATDQLDLLLADELVKNSNRVRSTAYAGYDRRRQLAFGFHDLCPRLAANYGVKVAHHGRIRMCPQDTPQQIMRGPHVGDPVAHRLVDRVLQRARA